MFGCAVFIVIDPGTYVSIALPFQFENAPYQNGRVFCFNNFQTLNPKPLQHSPSLHSAPYFRRSSLPGTHLVLWDREFMFRKTIQIIF